jgi:chemotaxis protein MotB
MDATPIIIKKKKAHAHAHHGGSWKVAYADFVTAMMAFFMVMWIMGLSDETRAQIQGYFNDPVGFARSMPKSRAVLNIKGLPVTKPNSSPKNMDQPYRDEKAAIQKVKQDVEKALAANKDLKKLLEHLDIKITDKGLRIELLEDRNDFFESGNAVLKPGAIRIIDMLGKVLADSKRPMIVEGHTDSAVYAGDPDGNYELSEGRALALARELRHAGVTTVRDVKGLADHELRDPEHPLSSVNRRVSILLPFVVSQTSTERMPVDEVRDLVKGAAMPPKIEVPTVHLQPPKPTIFDGVKPPRAHSH